jgi:hypothetical protein
VVPGGKGKEEAEQISHVIQSTRARLFSSCAIFDTPIKASGSRERFLWIILLKTNG